MTGDGRDRLGRFLPGGPPGPGRPRGLCNRATQTLAQLRAEMLASWDRVDGPRIVDELARTDPATWVRLLVSLMPRSVQDDTESAPAMKPTRIVLVQEIDEGGIRRFVESRSADDDADDDAADGA